MLGRSREDPTPLNYHSIVMGFVSGCLQTMSFHPTVVLANDALVEPAEMSASLVLSGRSETIFEVDAWKVKEED